MIKDIADVWRDPPVVTQKVMRGKSVCGWYFFTFSLFLVSSTSLIIDVIWYDFLLFLGSDWAIDEEDEVRDVDTNVEEVMLS